MLLSREVGFTSDLEGEHLSIRVQCPRWLLSSWTCDLWLTIKGLFLVLMYLLVLTVVYPLLLLLQVRRSGWVSCSHWSRQAGLYNFSSFLIFQVSHVGIVVCMCIRVIKDYTQQTNTLNFSNSSHWFFSTINANYSYSPNSRSVLLLILIIFSIINFEPFKLLVAKYFWVVLEDISGCSEMSVAFLSSSIAHGSYCYGKYPNKGETYFRLNIW